jgi:putative peptidoglycan binding protein
MKTHSIHFFRTFSSATLAAVLSLTLPSISQAKDKGHGNNGPGSKGHDNKGNHQADSHKHEPKFEKKFEPKVVKKIEQKFVQKIPHKDDHNRGVYMAHPRSGFVLSPGIGYAGRGYYYGPPNSPYYYQHPDVKFYPKRESFPRGYAFQPNNQYAADEIAVQEALTRLGYYQGPIDGRIGPQTLFAIGQYQRDHGMGVTNAIVPTLLRALGVQ